MSPPFFILPLGDDCRLDKYISLLLCFASLLCIATTTLVSDPEASEQLHGGIRFRGYLHATIVPIVSHAEFEIYLFDR